jgi:predicted dehydrogenase
MFKIVVVGPGLIGTKHIEIVRKADSADLVGIVCSDASYDKCCNIYPEPVFRNLQEAIAQCCPDGVIVSSPNEYHLEHLKTCAEHGVPVLLEKPALLSTEEFDQFEEFFGREYAESRVLVGHHRVHSTQLLQARKMIASGLVGKVNGFVGRAAFYKPSHYFEVAPWRTRLPGGGPLLINLIHEVQTMRLLVGELSDIVGFKTSQFRGFEVEDTVALSLRFETGALGSFFLTDTSVSPFSWELTSGENPSYPLQRDLGCYEVYGTHGCLSIPDLTLYSQEEGSRSWWRDLKRDRSLAEFNNPLIAQFNHFLEIIKGRELPLVSLVSGMNNVKVIEQLSRALL